MIRIFDIVLSFLGIIFGFPLYLCIFILCYFDTSSPIYKQVRIGKNKKLFVLFKFRTVKLTAPTIPSHNLDPLLITSIGKILRHTKLDELPQLLNVLKGDMSIVGPRPSLPSQKELIEAREKLNLYKFRPGITGLGQVLGLDMREPLLLAEIDSQMMQKHNLKNYLSYILITILKIIGVQHASFNIIQKFYQK